MAFNSTIKDQPLFYSLLALLLWAPLPLGSNRVWSAMLLTVMALLLLLLWLQAFYRGRVVIPANSIKAKPALLALLLLQAWVLLQCISLPSFLTGNASSSLYAAVNRTVHPISIAAADSFYALLLGLGYCAVFVLVLLLVNSKSRVKQFCYAIILSGVFQAAFGSFMVLSGENYLFFVKKWAGEGVASGTFVNRNHFAAYLGMALAFGVGMLLQEWQRAGKEKNHRETARDIIQLLLGEKARLRLFLAIMVIGLVMTHSRMGNIAFVSSLLITGAVFAYKTRRLNTKVVLFFASILLVDAVIIGNWFGLEKLVDRIENTQLETESRTEINISAMPIVAEFAALGSGANTLPSILPGFMRQQAPTSVEHAHNDYAELLITLGLPGFLLLGAALLLVVTQVVQAAKMPYAVVMAITYMVIHSFSDFNLFIPAVAFTVCASLALAFCPSERDSRRVKQ
jgi:O-antigen ligase